MRYRYPLPKRLVNEAATFAEFANGGAQCHARLRDGSVQAGLLVSNASAIVAMRNQTELPFEPEDIASLFQTEEDRSPSSRGDWRFFDVWDA